MTKTGGPPGDAEFELTILGPGYGESILLHVGNGRWVVVDSCLEGDGRPGSLRYLEQIGVNPARNVGLIVATHWHDDHIRGMARLVELCPDADFCCAAALCREEFLTLVGTLEGRHFSASGSGLREVYGVFSQLESAGKKPTHALANRVLFQHGKCTISSLSPDDAVFQKFLISIERLLPNQGKSKTRIPSLTPNEAAVALWVDVQEFSLLLGADLEKRGWVTILKSEARPTGRAAVFKIPHHGSKSADEPAVRAWMLEAEPLAVLTPWRRGRSVLPTKQDVKRIENATSNAWITSKCLSGQPDFKHENRAVEKALRESGARIRRLARDSGAVRLRRFIDADDQWKVETFGSAGRLSDYVA